jgi:ABC-2 type transport system permease protein
MVRIWALFKISFLTNIRYKVNFFAESISALIPIIPAVTMLQNGNDTVAGFASSQQYALYLLVAFAVWGFVEALWSFIFKMRNQMKEGILDETLMMPLSISELILGWSFDGIVSTIASTLPLILVSGYIAFANTSLLQVFLTLLILALTIFSGYCFSLILIGLMLVWKEANQLVSFLGNIAPFVCGVIIPMVRLPKIINIISFPLPYTWALDLIRGILFDYPLYIGYVPELLILAGLTVCYYVLGKVLFDSLYQASREKGGVIGY